MQEKKESNSVIEKLYKGDAIIERREMPAGGHRYYVKTSSDEKASLKTGVTTFIGIKDKSVPLMIFAVEQMRDKLLETLVERPLTDEDIIKSMDAHRETKDNAADIGTKIHAWIEGYIKFKMGLGELPERPTDPAIILGVNGWLSFVEEHEIEYIASEKLVYSMANDFVGTLDLKARIDGKLAMLDIKSSNGLYNSVLMQTAAYLKADEEESGDQYETRWAVRVAKETEEEYIARMEKKGKPTYPPYVPFEAMCLDEYDVDADYEAFLAFKQGFEWNKKTDFYLNKK